jgi:hypothetical protein
MQPRIMKDEWDDREAQPDELHRFDQARGGREGIFQRGAEEVTRCAESDLEAICGGREAGELVFVDGAYTWVAPLLARSGMDPERSWQKTHDILAPFGTEDSVLLRPVVPRAAQALFWLWQMPRRHHCQPPPCQARATLHRKPRTK